MTKSMYYLETNVYKGHKPCANYLVKASTCASSLHGNHPHRHDDVRESLLLLHVQDGEASLQDDVLHDVQMTDEAAVSSVQSTALPCHVILYNDDSIGPQALPRSHQELQQIFICQVS